MSNPNPSSQLEYPYAARPAVYGPSDEMPSTTMPSRPGATWLGLAGVAIVFLFTNFVVVPLIEAIDDEGGVVFFCFGIIIAEGFVLAVWLVWGGGSFLKRLALHWAAVVVLGLVWLIGAVATEGVRDGDIRDGLEVVPFSLPLFSLAIQLPLWIARLYFGWRLVDACADAEPVRPLGTRDLMFGTVIVAISLALARLAEGMNRNSEGWLVWAILSPSVAGISLVSVFPVAVWMLRTKNIVIGLICIPVQTTIAIVVTVTIMAMMERVNLREVFAIAMVVIGFAAALAATALAARGAGIRLQIGNASDGRDAVSP